MTLTTLYERCLIGLSGNLCNYVKTLSSDRVIRVKVKTVFSKPRHLHMGIPRGSVISPLLVNILLYGDDNDNNNDNKCIQRRSSRGGVFFGGGWGLGFVWGFLFVCLFVVVVLTISLLQRELTPTHTLKWPKGANLCKSCATYRALITCNLQRATWYEGTAQLLSLTEFKQHLF